jgi:prolyl oligopeptidase
MCKKNICLKKYRPFYGLHIILLTILIVSAASWHQIQVIKKPPKTRKDNVKEIIHGVEIIDPYRWLEDQESPETRAWIEDQNEYTESILGSLQGRENLERRLAELMRVDVINMPTAANGRYFFSKRLADQDLDIIYKREGLDGEDEILIDPHKMSSDKTVSINIRAVSNDGKILVYSVRKGSEDETSIRLFDVDQLKDLSDQLPKGRYLVVSITPDKSGLYYTRFGVEGGRVRYHKIGTNPAQDIEIFGQGYGADKMIFSWLSEDGHHLVIHVLHGAGGSTSEIYYKNVKTHGPIVTVVNDIDAHFYGWLGGEQLFIKTDWNAPNGRILSIDLKNLPQKPSEWREIIPMSEGIIDGISTSGGKLIVRYLENAMSVVKIFETNGMYVRDISLPAVGSFAGPLGRWESPESFFRYSSFHIPTRIYRYDIKKGTQTVWAKVDVPIDNENILVKQVWYESKDGTKVPMFLTHRRGIKLDGTNPMMLFGYGGFGSSRKPEFDPIGALWVELGGIFAMPNLRGGGEFGQDWHKAGMLDKKQNVFDDFIAAAEWLVEYGYTKPEKLAICGASNGGLLVGAALTQRPDLFRAVACSYPLLDMLRYHKFLIAKLWVPEYGSSEDPEQFKYLYAYSPYHNVKSGTKYPATLFITGDSDTRVAPLHARKMTALLQDATGSSNPVLILYDTMSGHTPAGMPLSKQIEDATNWMSFFMWQLGMINR